MKIFALPRRSVLLFRFIVFLPIIVLVANIQPGFAQAITFDGKTTLAGKYLYVFEDVSNNYTIANISKVTDFSRSIDETPNFGNSENNIWVKFSITNKSNLTQLILELAHPFWDTVRLYRVNDSLMQPVEFSSRKNFRDRKYEHVNPAFDINISEEETQDYILHLRASDQAIVPLIIYSYSGFFDSVLFREIIYGVLFGIMIAMMLYNLFIYFSVKEKAYIYYVGYILFTVFTHSTLFGYSYKYLWPNMPAFNHAVFIVFPCLVGFFGIMFAREFLQAKKNNPWLNNALTVGAILYGLAIIFRLLHKDYFSYRMVDLGGITVAMAGFLLGLKQSLKGHRPAQFFLVAWSVFLVGLVLFSLRNLNLVPYNNFTNYTMQFGAAIELILLSIALADKINFLKKEQAIAQQKALDAAIENERIVSNQNVLLENKVEERTRDLKQANIEINNTLTQLKEAQTQLIDSEKMASLGQLTAGIAHEINNPINFVCSNISPLKRNFEDVLDMMNAYEKIDEAESPEVVKEMLNKIKARKDNLDFEYTKEEIGLLLNGMREGAERTVEIVKGLKIFSRIDNQGINSANLNEGIESTLVLLNNQIQPGIQLIKDLGNLPSVQCYPGKMNQVFMNIITNAIHAVKDEKMTNTPPTIWVNSTLEDENHIKISIRDNGPGIPDHVKKKIFEPFFTTKEVGKGTGLGLSIVFSIIEAHKGTIQVETEVGKGTEFKITLPVKQI